MKCYYVLMAVIATVNGWRLSDLAREEWQTFKLEHKKQYENATEELHRLRIYLHKRRRIAKHNRRYHRGLESYSLKTNQFSDMTYQEYRKIATGFRPTLKSEISVPMFISLGNAIIKESVDWRDLGAVSEVKDQLECQSCWAFSAAGSLEGQLFIKNKTLASLSAQNLVDCSTGNYGCKGGDTLLAFEYIRDNIGIDIEKYYPYEGKDNTCRYKPQYSGGYDIGYKVLLKGDEENLKRALATIGPVSVAVDSLSNDFDLYMQGVYYNKRCTNLVNHAMLVVGYGTDKKKGDYWLLKNSFGTTWGEKGYMRLARNRNNHCGIASYAFYPVLPKSAFKPLNQINILINKW